MKRTTMKCIVWFCLINGVAWVWCSYVLAWFGRVETAQSLSQTALIEIVSVVLAYSIKSLLEKRADFGAIGRAPDCPEKEDVGAESKGD